MQQESSSSILIWMNKQLNKKKLSVNKILDLKGGNLFLQIIHANFPKWINLTKIYIRPKSNFQISQNFKYLSQIFKEQKWKKIDIDKFINSNKNLEKDLFNLGSYLMKTLTALKNKQKQIVTARQIRKATQQNIIQSNSLNNVSMISQAQQQKIEGLFNQISLPGIDTNQALSIQIQTLQKQKNSLLRKIIDIEHIAKNTDNIQAAKNLILKILKS